MRKKIDYKLEYRENGEQKVKMLTVDFVSNWIIKKFSDLILLGGEAEQAYIRISDIHTELAGEELTDEKIDLLKQEIEQCNNKILEFNENGYFEKRYEILKRLLIDNGYNDEKLLSFEFWDQCVDPVNIMEFMYEAVYKDVQKKKIFRQ